MHRIRPFSLIVAFTAALMVLNSAHAQWPQEKQLLAFDGDNLDFFGAAVSVDGDVAVVGASNKGDTGAAYVYRFNAASQDWVFEQKLTASDGASGDSFGLGRRGVW